MYHSHRQPCRAAMLFILLNVPDRMDPVSENASFISLSCFVDSRTSCPMPKVMYILQQLDLGAQALERLVILTFEVVGKAVTCGLVRLERSCASRGRRGETEEGGATGLCLQSSLGHPSR